MGVRTRWRRFLQKPGTADMRRARKIAAAAGAREAGLRDLSDTGFADAVAAMRAQPRWTDAEFTRFCALGREAARRTLGQRAFDVQLQGTVGLLTGHVMEMATGEGKTLVGALAAAGYALRGRRVHVVSVNDYLARRDAEWMRELYALLGVGVGWVDQWTEDRRCGYACDVTYVPVSELGFDVLRDRMCTDPTQIVLPEPDVVIVDEADSVLVDEARVPLVLAGSAAPAAHDPLITDTVRRLRAGVHYETDDDGRNVHLTEAGLRRVERRLGDIDLYTAEHAHRLTEVHVALHAHALLHRDVDYLVRAGRVELIDDAKGRVAHLQRWPDGLQAAVEAKEGLATSASGEVLDSTVVQAVIVRYRDVCGMSGTAVAVGEQLHEFYGLDVGAVPTHVACVRTDEPDRRHADVAAKEAAVVAYVAEIHAARRPVLLGTLDVAESERLALALKEADVDAAVLNARNDAEEATIIARAGELGRVTISTQMAGRGTDIRLADGVAELGGLCVVGSGRYHTKRLDDQLRGRAGRQGDPGSSVFFTSGTDELVVRNAPGGDVEHAQRVAEGAHLESQRTTWRYSRIVDDQRAVVLAHRDLVLRGDRAVRHLEERSAQRCAQVRESVGDDALARAARAIALFHLDRGWADHLAFLSDVREGIHLRALARESPLDEYQKIAVQAFDPFFPDVYDRVAETFAEAEVTADGVMLDDLGLRRPTSTWTYLVTDNPFGSETDRLFGGLRRRRTELG
jgi:preprotein translocase subunit SecA